MKKKKKAKCQKKQELKNSCCTFQRPKDQNFTAQLQRGGERRGFGDTEVELNDPSESLQTWIILFICYQHESSQHRLFCPDNIEAHMRKEKEIKITRVKTVKLFFFLWKDFLI